MTPLRSSLALLALMLMPLAGASASEDAADTPAQLKGFPESQLTITHAGGRDSFRVWIADTSARQQQGLMFVRRMAADRGMLFPQRAPRNMAMWMKNTYLPLDMVFIGENGVITGIVPDTKPLTLDTIESPGPITAVLELNAGEAARRGIRAGDKVAIAP
jgi:uncharacterized membrane protein (UPF0127 family)